MNRSSLFYKSAHHLFLILATVYAYCVNASSEHEHTFKIEAQAIDASVTGHILKGPSVLNDPERFVWGGSVIRGDDGLYHMFYSTWESGENIPQFSDSWVQYSKIAYAVSSYPDRDFKTKKIFLLGNAENGKPNAWDAQMVHNPHIQKFGDKYYLYYIGSRDPGTQAKGSTGEYVNKRNRIQQLQQIGVISFDNFDQILTGSFERPSQPILTPRTRVKPDNVVDPSPYNTKAKPDNLIVVNPSVVQRPSDGKFLLYFKGNIYDPEWKGVHGVAISDSPIGPFKPLDRFVFELKMDDGTFAAAEDPYVWFHPEHNNFYAVFKDFTGKFTNGKPGLAVMWSKNGMDWRKNQNPLFMKKEVALKNGKRIPMDRLERPQLLIDEKGNPTVLYAAGAITNVNVRNDGTSFNVQIPLTLISK